MGDLKVLAAIDVKDVTITIVNAWGEYKLSVDFGGSDIDSWKISAGAAKALQRAFPLLGVDFVFTG